MRKLLVISLLALSIHLVSAATTSLYIAPNIYTNLLSLNNGQAKITQIIVTATTATNVALYFVDAPTNQLWYTNSAYTNTIRYATNQVYTWTNFYGVTVNETNIALIDVTNNVVNAWSNMYPTRLSVGALAGASSVYGGVNYYFNDGVWVSNNSAPATVTITYQQ